MLCCRNIESNKDWPDITSDNFFILCHVFFFLQQTHDTALEARLWKLRREVFTSFIVHSNRTRSVRR